jgi:hypothetical protein
VDELSAAGLPVKPGREKAWQDFESVFAQVLSQ